MIKAAVKAGKDDAKRINAYLAALDPKKRAALEKLRSQVRAAAPDAEECISYQMPAFRRGGVILCYAAWKAHCAVYPGGAITKQIADDLAAFDFDKGTIRFTPEKPLPAALVRKIVKARIDEIEDRKRSRKSAAVKKAKKAAPPTERGEADVDAFFASLKHPLKKEIAEIRAIILGANKAISEGVKWNSLSFKTADYFVTVNLRSTNAVQLVFHRGAKSKDGEGEMSVPDPKGLIKWVSSHRCIVTPGKGLEIAANRKAVEAIIKAWVKQT